MNSLAQPRPRQRWDDPTVGVGVDIITLPHHLHESLVAYIETGRPTGGFLEAVLSDSLKGAVLRGDDESRAMLVPLTCWVYQQAPGGCHGSVELVRQWIREGGMQQLKATAS